MGQKGTGSWVRIRNTAQNRMFIVLFGLIIYWMFTLMCLQYDIVVIVEHRCCLLAMVTKFTAGLVDTGSKFTTDFVEC
jgi:hypothetical protein